METNDTATARYKSTDGFQDRYFTDIKSAVDWARNASSCGTVIVSKRVDAHSWSFLKRYRFGKVA